MSDFYMLGYRDAESKLKPKLKERKEKIKNLKEEIKALKNENMALQAQVHDLSIGVGLTMQHLLADVVDVVYLNDKTVVKFSDGSHEIVVFDHEYGIYDQEKAIMAGLLKHVYGSSYLRYMKEFIDYGTPDPCNCECRDEDVDAAHEEYVNDLVNAFYCATIDESPSEIEEKLRAFRDQYDIFAEPQTEIFNVDMLDEEEDTADVPVADTGTDFNVDMLDDPEFIEDVDDFADYEAGYSYVVVDDEVADDESDDPIPFDDSDDLFNIDVLLDE